MRRFRRLLGSQNRQAESASQPNPNSAQTLPEPTPLDSPPSYDQDQIERLRDELHQVRLQLSEVQARTGGPQSESPPGIDQSSTIATELPNQASTQPLQPQNQDSRRQERSRRTRLDPVAVLVENGWDIAPWQAGSQLRKRDEALHWAAAFGRTSTVQYLIQLGASGLTEMTQIGWETSALASAAKANHAEIVQLFMKQATEETLQSNFALYLATKEGHTEIVRLLLTKWPSRTKTHPSSREGALCIAAEKGYETITQLILEKGVSYAIQSEMRNSSPLCCAIDAEQIEIVQLLLQDRSLSSGDFKTDIGSLALSRAAQNGNEAAVKLILQREVVVEQSAMYWAVKLGNESILQQLLAAGGKPNPIFDNAVKTGNEKIVRLLLNSGAEIGNGLRSAAQTGYPLIAQLLLDHGASVDELDSHKRTPLHVAARSRQSGVVNLLLERGANIAAQESEGKTPLYLAVVSGDKSTLQVLLDHGAAKFSIGRSPIQVAFEEAVGKGAAEAIQLLIDHGFKLNFNAGSEQNLLVLAAQNACKPMVQLLLDNGANIEGEDFKGRRALQLAAMNGHYEIVKTLLDRGADPKAQNKFGRTAKYWAAKNGHKEVVRLLEDDKLWFNAHPASKSKFTV